MENFDYDKIRNMEYDSSRDRYIAPDGSELKVTPYSNGNGYKYDYYESSTYNNAPHNSKHVKSDLNENWEKTTNNRDNGTQEKDSGSGCYLTTACMKHKQDNFNDNCIELTTLRWFRDNFVTEDDIKYYYEKAPMIVEKIDSLQDSTQIYNWIYENIVSACVEAIKNKDFDFTYNRYKNSILALEEQFIQQDLNKENATIKILTKLNI